MLESLNNKLYHPVRIGNLELEGNLFLAPVAGFSDRAFRSICLSEGASFTYTEMISAEALARGSAKTERLMQRAFNETVYGVQLFGGNPEVLARAAQKACEKANPALIDINAGCPVPKIIKSGAGAALTREPDALFAVVRAVADTVEPVPVTVKIRSGWDNEHLTWQEAAIAAIEAGAAAITLHPRTQTQGYDGKADWELLKALVELAKRKASRSGVPVAVFGSGDVFSPEDAKAMLEQTGVDGVMFARGALGNPFIFRETRDLLESGSYVVTGTDERLATGFRELELLTADVGEAHACREMRKRFCAYVKGFPNAAALRKTIVECETVDDYRGLYGKYF
jgi:nifR3 family TIM-barrel protein